MINRAAITCMMIMLLLVSLVLAADSPMPGDKNSAPGNSQYHKGDKLQEYINDIPQQGNYYEWDGTKWQRYSAAIPQHGNYLKEVKPLERLPDTQEVK